MIVDMFDSAVETVTLDFDTIGDFDHSEMTETIQSAQKLLCGRDNCNIWRFNSLYVDWHNKQVEIDFERLL